MSAGPPIFVVGLPRSGTTLLSAMLAAHSRLDCGPETHFFANLRRADIGRLVEPARWPGPAVAFIEALEQDGVSIAHSFGVSRDEVKTYLAARPPSVQAVLESLTAVRAARAGKDRWIEKTPNHLLHAARIRQLYPDAQIIRIVRDPRDVALSLRKVPFASTSVLANLYSCVERDERSRAFFADDSLSMTVQYEDLVSDPHREMVRLCTWLGVGFEEHMLHPDASAGAVIGSGEWWKNNVRNPISGARVQAWRRELSPEQQSVASLVCAELLTRYGYPDAGTPRLTLQCLPVNAAFIEQNEDALIQFAHEGVRLHPWNAQAALPDLAWGLPGQFGWPLGSTSRSRATEALGIALRVVRHRAAGGRVRWIAEDTHVPPRRGVVDRVCDAVLRLVSRPITRAELLTSLAAGRQEHAAPSRRGFPAS